MKKSMAASAAALCLCAGAMAQNVLVIHADSFVADTQSKLQGQGLNVTLFDGRNGTPTLNELQQYDSVMVYTNSSFQNATAMGDVLADYVDGGGGVVQQTFGFNVSPLGGRWANGGYQPVTNGNQSQNVPLTIGTRYLPNHPVLANVNSFSGGSSSYHNQVSMANSGIRIADWSNGIPLVAERDGFNGGIIALNFFPPSSDARGDFWTSSTDGEFLMANALRYVIPTPGAAALLGLGGLAAARRRR